MGIPIRRAMVALVGTAAMLEAGAATWVAPIGIPAPAFGIVQSAPAAPKPWKSPTAGFYYVCSSCAGATDANNSFGTPAKPRWSIPNTVPAGSVVELHGTYSKRHTSPNGLVLKGTAAAPVFIRGAKVSDRPTILNGWEVSGTYAILENLAFTITQSRDGLVLLGPASHLALRNSDLSGNPRGGGMAIGSGSGATADNIVIYHNYIHDNGDVKATFDQDVHGIAVGPRVSNLWVVDNELARSSGDGIQINAGNKKGDQATLHHIYVGRNVSHHNKQTGFWVKQAVDVIFSQNTSYGHRPSDSSPGAGMGAQYAPDYVWFLFNHIHDSESGITIASDSGLGTGTEMFIIGNLIHNIHTAASYNPNSGWSSGAMVLAGGTHTYVVNNTLWDIDAGINSPRSNGRIDVYNNIIDTPSKTGASQIFFEKASLAGKSAMDYNLLQNPSRLRWGENAQRDLAGFRADSGKGANSATTSDPKLSNAASADFRIQSISPAVDRGVDVDSIAGENVYARFQERYGIDIRKDIVGATRPLGSGYDIGAYEFTSTSDPSAPTSHR